MAMTRDVIVVGGGLAGSAIAGTLARAGLHVLLVEREAEFRDRIRGETIWPWGVTELRRLGLEETCLNIGANKISSIYRLNDKQLEFAFALDPVPMLTFRHRVLQDALFAWATETGVEIRRPAKVIVITPGPVPTATIQKDGEPETIGARLIIGADGKTSAARRWIGGSSESDPEYHRFGGMLVSGAEFEPDGLYIGSTGDAGLLWFRTDAGFARLYLRLPIADLRERGLDRSVPAFLALLREGMPELSIENVEPAGPLGFFPNSCTWASRISGENVVLIGDAAGSADPTVGQGMSLLFRDVRELSDLLLDGDDWPSAIREYARRRAIYFSTIRTLDNWYAQVGWESGPDADLRQERFARARELDPTLGGFDALVQHGPDGLLQTEETRRHYFGEDLI